MRCLIYINTDFLSFKIGNSVDSVHSHDTICTFEPWMMETRK